MAGSISRSSPLAGPPRRGIPRAFDAAASALGLVVFLPLIALCALAVVLTSAGPPLYRQRRVGRGGTPFWLYKLRTMRPSSGGSLVTARGDARVTRVGRFLRRSKLDELPQLWNVLRGDMALVGPRPEVPEYVDLADPLWRRVLAVRPGITDPVTLRLRDEEDMLAAAPGDPETFYRDQLQPRKLRAYMRYLDRRNLRTDLRTLADTLIAIVAPGRGPAGPEGLEP